MLRSRKKSSCQPYILVTFGMLSETADQWSMDQQATIPAPYTDCKGQCLAAWKKLVEGPSEPRLLAPH